MGTQKLQTTCLLVEVAMVVKCLDDLSRAAKTANTSLDLCDGS